MKTPRPALGAASNGGGNEPLHSRVIGTSPENFSDRCSCLHSRLSACMLWLPHGRDVCYASKNVSAKTGATSSGGRQAQQSDSRTHYQVMPQTAPMTSSQTHYQLMPQCNINAPMTSSQTQCQLMTHTERTTYDIQPNLLSASTANYTHL